MGYVASCLRSRLVIQASLTRPCDRQQAGERPYLTVDGIKSALKIDTESPWLDNLLKRFELHEVSCSSPHAAEGSSTLQVTYMRGRNTWFMPMSRIAAWGHRLRELHQLPRERHRGKPFATSPVLPAPSMRPSHRAPISRASARLCHPPRARWRCERRRRRRKRRVARHVSRRRHPSPPQGPL
jgi:hypothetical protein